MDIQFWLDEKVAKSARVLLIEDDPVTRWMVRKTLKRDCILATASSAGKAYAAYASYAPDVVFLDINLPDASGHDVLAWIMRNDPGAWVVMFTASNTAEDVSRALGGGARGYIAKPFIKEKLLEYVNDCPKLH